MNIYLDFEATQFKENVIAIGATCAYGDFDCLVCPPKGDKITNFITQLTGITKEMAYNALSYDEAFYDLYLWITDMMEQAQSPVFYHVFGNMDKVFLKKSVPYIHPKFLQDFVNNLADSLIDDSVQVCRFFHTKAVGVFKALHYFDAYLMPNQDHDPLNDAIALKYLMNYISIAHPIEECPFEENKPKPKVIDNGDISRTRIIATHTSDKNAKPRIFYSIDAATDWALQKVRVQSPLAGKKNVTKKINKAIRNNTAYLNWKWRMEKGK